EAVEFWLDQTASGHDARQPAIGERPSMVTNGLEGLPAVQFSLNRHLDITHHTDLDAGVGQTVFVIHHRQSGNTLLQKSSSDGLNPGDWRATPATYQLSGTGPTPNDPALHETRVSVGRYDGSWIEVFHNGTLAGMTPFAGSVTNPYDIVIGDPGLPALTFDGTMAEIMLFDRALSDVERGQMESYLYRKYFGGLLFSNQNYSQMISVLDNVNVSLDVMPVIPVSNLNVTVWYRTGTSGVFSAFSLSPYVGSTFTTLNPLPVGNAPTIEFYITADFTQPSAGSRTWPPNGALNPIRIDRAPAAVRQIGPTRRRSGFTFSEIMYNPRSRPDGKQLEFIELFNSEPINHDLEGYRISGEVDFTFPPGTVIQALGRLVIARNPADLESEYGIDNTGWVGGTVHYESYPIVVAARDRCCG
ncbi:MAG: lamin tail domain-containing protein, partial [Verrucomicrobiota bacterium]